MYYEEQTIDGILCWRTTPNGKWVSLSLSQMNDKLADAQCRIASLYKQLDDVYTRL